MNRTEILAALGRADDRALGVLKGQLLALAHSAGVDIVRLRSLRHPIGRRARLMASLGIELVIDVGANGGQFGLEVRRAGYRGRIVSIEPLATPFEELARIAEADKHWTAIQSAVGSKAGTATMHVAANRGASSSILPMLALHSQVAPQARYLYDERVEVATLDDLIRPHLKEAVSLFTKADVQGYELEVLRGGDATLASSVLVQLEMSLMPLYSAAPTFADVLDFMTQRDFCLVGIEPGVATEAGLMLQVDGLFLRNNTSPFPALAPGPEAADERQALRAGARPESIPIERDCRTG